MTYDANDREALIIAAEEALGDLFILGVSVGGFTIVERAIWINRLDTPELDGYLTVEKDGETIEFTSVSAGYDNGWWMVESHMIADR